MSVALPARPQWGAPEPEQANHSVPQVVLKKVLPAQRDSALNELRIARRLNADGGQKYTVVYIDSMQDHAQDLWLVLRRVQPSRFGVSLTEYINSGFFQVRTHSWVTLELAG
jgi:hypothetical protein